MPYTKIGEMRFSGCAKKSWIEQLIACESWKAREFLFIYVPALPTCKTDSSAQATTKTTEKAEKVTLPSGKKRKKSHRQRLLFVEKKPELRTNTYQICTEHRYELNMFYCTTEGRLRWNTVCRQTMVSHTGKSYRSVSVLWHTLLTMGTPLFHVKACFISPPFLCRKEVRWDETALDVKQWQAVCAIAPTSQYFMTHTARHCFTPNAVSSRLTSFVRTSSGRSQVFGFKDRNCLSGRSGARFSGAGRWGFPGLGPRPKTKDQNTHKRQNTWPNEEFLLNEFSSLIFQKNWIKNFEDFITFFYLMKFLQWNE